MVSAMKAGVEGLGMLVQDLVAYVYIDNEIVTSTQTERLQRAFGILIELFDQVGLQANIRKMVRMTGQSDHTPCIMPVVV